MVETPASQVRRSELLDDLGVPAGPEPKVRATCGSRVFSSILTEECCDWWESFKIVSLSFRRHVGQAMVRPEESDQSVLEPQT